MSYLEIVQSFSRRWNETYRIANDLLKTATNNVGTSSSPSQLFGSSSPAYQRQQFILEHADILLFVGSAIYMRLRLYFWQKQRRALADHRRPSSLRSLKNKNPTSMETTLYYMASCAYMLSPLIPISLWSQTRRFESQIDRLRGQSELLLFAGSALIFRFVYWNIRPPSSMRQRRRKAGSLDLHEESKLYQIKVQNGFKDPKLQQFIDACVDQKVKLKKVGSPEDLRKKKLDRLKKEIMVSHKGPLQLSEEKLQTIRSNLNKVYDE
jgi:hypothetical protein